MSTWRAAAPRSALQVVVTGLRQIWTDWVEGSLGLPRPVSAPLPIVQAAAGAGCSPNVVRLTQLTTPLAFVEEAGLSRTGTAPGGARRPTSNTSALSMSGIRSVGGSRPGSRLGPPMAVIKSLKEEEKRPASVAGRGGVRPGKTVTAEQIVGLRNLLIDLLHGKQKAAHRMTVASLVGEHTQLHQVPPPSPKAPKTGCTYDLLHSDGYVEGVSASASPPGSGSTSAT